MTLTLLDIVQEILSALDSDEVNSISDNTESLQVATIVKRKYYDIISRTSGLPEHRRLIQLDATGILTPTLMHCPDGVDQIDWIKYFNEDSTVDEGFSYTYPFGYNDNTTPVLQYDLVQIVSIEDLLKDVNNLNPDDSNVVDWNFTEGPYTFDLRYQNDRQPTQCAVLENLYIIFDAYDAAVDSFLQTSKSMAYATVIPTFLMEDTFIPDLDDANFALLVNESKALAFFELKQTIHQPALREVGRQWSSVQKNQSLVNQPTYFDQLPYFGRK